MSWSPIIAALLGFGLTFGLIRFLAPRAERYGLIDHPAAGRKDHVGNTPTVGGLAIVFGLVLTALIAQFASQVHPAFWVGLLMIALTGTADDMYDLQPAIKFAAQIGAALLMSYWGGLILHSLGDLVSDKPLMLGRFAVLLTVFAVIGVVNAINLCDGADGLAGGLVFIAVFWICLMNAVSANWGTLTLALGLLGCIAAFLVFNLRSPWRSRASVFLGDAGSLSLGFVLAWLTVDAAQEGSQLFAPVTAIWLVAIPISDTILCMSRRLLRGQSPFRADVDGLVRLMNSADDFTGPVNLGNPGEFTILELAQKIIAMTGSKSEIVYQPLPADDPTQRKPDIALAKRILDWTPRVALDDGLPRAIAYFRDSSGGAR